MTLIHFNVTLTHTLSLMSAKVRWDDFFVILILVISCSRNLAAFFSSNFRCRSVSESFRTSLRKLCVNLRSSSLQWTKTAVSQSGLLEMSSNIVLCAVNQTIFENVSNKKSIQWWHGMTSSFPSFCRVIIDDKIIVLWLDFQVSVLLMLINFFMKILSVVATFS